MSLEVPPAAAPYGERIVRDVPQLEEVWSYINPQMLYGRHMGFRGNFERKLAERDPKALELHGIVEDVKDEAKDYMKARAVWRFFRVRKLWECDSRLRAGRERSGPQL